MLILTRRPNDSLLIQWEGSDQVIEIKVTEITGNQVRLGITAPQGCRILRKELAQTVEANRQAAASSLENVRGMADLLKGRSK